MIAALQPACCWQFSGAAAGAMLLDHGVLLAALALPLRLLAWLRLHVRRHLLGGDGLAHNPPPPRARDMLLVGHRGASAQMPENTAAAFQWVFAHGFGAIELDVHRTRDGRLVVHHDSTLRRTCALGLAARFAPAPANARAAPRAQSQGGGEPGGGGWGWGLGRTPLVDTPISELDWAAVRAVPVGRVGGRLLFPMLLEDVFAMLPPGTSVLVEMKVPKTLSVGRASNTLDPIFGLAAAAAAAYTGGADIRFISFSFEGVAHVKTLVPARKCYALSFGTVAPRSAVRVRRRRRARCVAGACPPTTSSVRPRPGRQTTCVCARARLADTTAPVPSCAPRCGPCSPPRDTHQPTPPVPRLFAPRTPSHCGRCARGPRRGAGQAARPGRRGRRGRAGRHRHQRRRVASCVTTSVGAEAGG